MRFFLLAITLAATAAGQVYSPKVLLAGQPDPTNLARFAQGIYQQAGAKTPRERAEAIWRYFLTDGRFVPPGFWYHIAGFAYEEPMGEVLDPLKLINSYGYGLCYQIAPVLEAVYRAGGFEDARVWFLTGHTVTEVFYDGAYHYYDSDMLGYTTVGNGPPRKSTVASVHQIELDGTIMTSKLKGPREVDSRRVDYPWYPADVRAGAAAGLAELFTTASDNSLFAYERAPQAYSSDFVLRPHERMVRYFQPEQSDVFYLPYKFDGSNWSEFPKDVPEYNVRVADGPKSEKDTRRWATGTLEYRPPISAGPTQVVDVESPYVIIDAAFNLQLDLPSPKQQVTLETSVDGGRTWISAGRVTGPHRGEWTTQAATLGTSAHGRRTAVSGVYGYLLRITSNTDSPARDLVLRTRFQLNPRTLPALASGRNELTYSAGPERRRVAVIVPGKSAREIATHVANAGYVESGGQGYWVPTGGEAEFLFELKPRPGESIVGLDAGGRFLDLSRGIAPDKFTAEVRKVPPVSSDGAAASLAWSLSPEGPFHTLWEYDPKLVWRDGVPIDRLLRWPEVDRHAEMPAASQVYVRYRSRGLAVDDFRLAYQVPGASHGCPLEITHVWLENGVEKRSVMRPPDPGAEWRYNVDTAPSAQITDRALIFECK